LCESPSRLKTDEQILSTEAESSMRRKVVALGLIWASAFALAPVRAVAESAPPPLVKITLSTYNASPGEPLVVYFNGAELANHKIKVYIDRPSNGVGYVTASPTGYGRKTFILSKYAQPNSRHALGLLDTATGHTYRRAFAVACDYSVNGVPGCL